MDTNILNAARRVCELQSEYDAANHDTTTADFMQRHGAKWLAERDKILGKIDQQRTEAIWHSARLLPPRELPIKPLDDCQPGQAAAIN
jgi:hypothetical protein